MMQAVTLSGRWLRRRAMAWAIRSAAALMLALPGPAAADEVVTSNGRLEGAVTFTGAGVSVGGRKVDWEDVRSIGANEGARVYGEPNLLRMRSGEVWPVQVVGLLDTVVRVTSPMIGERSVPVEQVAEIVLNRRAMPGGSANGGAARGATSQGGGASGGVLLTATGEALPGELMWISETELAVESLLGVMRMPREATAAYRFPSVDGDGGPARSGGDVVTLVGGGRLMGQVQPRDGGVTLVHPQLGEVAIDGGRVRSIRRAVAGATPLAELTPVRIEARPLFATARLADLPTAADPRLVLWSGGTVAYDLPHAGRLEATLQAVPRARGRATLRVLCDGKVVATRVVEADAAAQWLSVDLPAADVTLEADFGEVIAIPSGALLVEPRITRK